MKQKFSTFLSWFILITVFCVVIYAVLRWDFHCWRLLHPTAPSWLFWVGEH